MTHLDLNAAQGFLVNPELMIPNTNLVDRGKIATMTITNLSAKNMDGWIWIIPLDRNQIPASLNTGNPPQEIIDLSNRLKNITHEEITISYGSETVGSNIRFAAVLLSNANINSPNAIYSGSGIIIKRLA